MTTFGKTRRDHRRRAGADGRLPRSPNDVYYACGGGTQVAATFSPPGASPGNVVLVFAGAKLTLPQVKSADGGRSRTLTSNSGSGDVTPR